MRYIQSVAFFTFILLISVLFYLTYNTFELNDRQYQLAEKNLLSTTYKSLIKKDNVYPGGYDILNKVLFKQEDSLKYHYRKQGVTHNAYADTTLKKLFSEFVQRNPMDSIFNSIRDKYQLSKELQYLVTINHIRIADNDSVLFQFNEKKRYDFLGQQRQTSYGYIVGGELKTPLQQNLITEITVTSVNKYAFELRFSFYADKNNRQYHIFKATLPALVLALFALLSVLVIFYITFRSWIKVNRLAEMKTDFVDSITHEFHTPISTIVMANKNLQNDKVLADREKVKMLTDVVLRQSKRLEMLFGQVLDIARLQNVNLEKEREDLNSLLEEIVDDYKMKLADENIRITLEKSPDDPHIALNRFWFTTMLFNLFDNAIKYNDKEHKTIDIRLSALKHEIQLEIRDNGVGMEKEMIKDVFEKFYRANKKDMSHIPGLGLGLYYARQCVMAHGWKMKVKSEINKGSLFIISIS